MRSRRHSRFILGILGVGLLVGITMTAGPLQAASGVGPFLPEQSWDRKLVCPTIANCPRFLVLTNWGGAAVLDKETGLVWERSPDPTISTWSNARSHCARTVIGNRQGWRLPSFPELASLLDRTVSFPGPMLPPGHPFVGILVSAAYWSATTDVEDLTGAWAVAFDNGFVFSPTKTTNAQVWCVRGGGLLSEY